MPTIAEMQLLGSSLDDLSRTLMQNRILRREAQRDASREELDRAGLGLRAQEMANTRDFRSRQLEAESTEAADRATNRKLYLEAQKERNTEQRTHEGRMEAYQKQLLEKQETQAAIASLEKQFEVLERGVREGSIDPTEANARARAMVRAIREGPNIILKATPFGAMLDGEADMFKAPKRAKGRAVYKPADPNDPDSPLVPTITQDLDEEELKAVLGRAKAAPRPPPPPPKPGLIERIRSALGGTGTGPMAAPVDANAAPPALPAAPPAATEQDYLANRATAKQFVAGGMRVRVIGPDGRRGTIPKAQLAEALKQGYRVEETRAPDEALEGK